MPKSPVETVIHAFGSVSEFSRATGIPEKRVYRWRQTVEKGGRDGRVPDDVQPVILRAARDRGIGLTAEDLIDMRDAPADAGGAQ